MRKKLYKKSDILAAIKGSAGFVKQVADRLGCEWHVAKKNIERYPECIQALDDETQVVLDFTEQAAIKKIKEGDGSMIRFYLMTKGKDRGYTTDNKIKPTNVDDSIKITIDDEGETTAPQSLTSLEVNNGD